MVAYVLSRIGDIYAWGACDLYPITESWIKGRDTSATEAARSIADWKRKQGYGMTDLHAFDCSGLPSVPLKKQGIISAKKDCDGLWAICSKIEKTHLISGDLCFRHSSSDASDKTHVGVYVGAGRVVHAKGRDVGVVLEGIDQSSKTWWQDFARLKAYA
jgi:cell wall-associated NlpC family hydrolase